MCMKPKHNNFSRTGAAQNAASARDGFTLVEINLVLLLVGIGLVSLLGLFPVGLRQAGLATGDTVQAMFADRVLNTLQARASEITDWAEWSAFGASVLDGVSIDGKPIQAVDKISNYLGVEGNTIRYQLEFRQVFKDDKRLMRAIIRVSEREMGDLSKSPAYCTDFFFMGPPVP